MGLDVRGLPADARGGLSRRGRAFLGLAIVWLLLDQLTKAAVVAYFSLGRPSVVLVPQYLDLTYSRNPGAAFGLLHHVAWSRFLFILIAVGAIAAMAIWHRSLLTLPTVQRVGLSLVAAGAAGNLLDRVFRHGLVVDFIHFHLPNGFVWPDFNVADIGVTCGMTLYIVHTLITDFRRSAATDDAP